MTKTDAGLDDIAKPVDALARDILREQALDLEIVRLELEESTQVHAVIVLRRGGVDSSIRGHGVGLVDAVFDAMMQAYGTEHPSLQAIAVADFVVGAGFDLATGRRSDAIALATLMVRNSEGEEFRFTAATPSVTRSTTRVVVDALTFFINSERAYLQLQIALRDAKDRRRTDLVDRYRSQMGVLVAATSYAVIAGDKSRDGE
jgi:LeuA allosteric (dimerisation) domain